MIGNFIAVGAVVAGIFLLQAGNSLFASFLALRMNLAHFGDAVIGLVVTGYPFGFLLGCLLAPSVIRAVGHIRTFAVFAAVMSSAALCFPLWIHPGYWLALRLLTGFAAAGLFMVGESWLNEKTPRQMRGKVFALYMISNMTAVSSSQLFLGAADPLGPAFYMLCAALFSACLIPVALTRATAPAVPAISRLSIAALYRLSPLGVVGCIATGLANTAVGGLGPVYANRVGSSFAEVGTFMAFLLFGGMLLQWPIGRLSDRFDRRRVLIGVALANSLVAFAVAWFGETSRPVLLALITVYGGLAYTLYPLSLAHANDHAEPGQVVAVSSGLLLSWAAGSIVGPTIAGGAMTMLGPSGLFFYVSAVTGPLALFGIWRMTRRAAAPIDVQGPFVAQAQTSPAAAELHPRARSPEAVPEGGSVAPR